MSQNEKQLKAIKWMITVIAVLSVLTVAMTASAQTSTEPRRYRLVFQPSSQTPIVFRNDAGQIIGQSTPSTLLEIVVYESVIRSATTANGIDMQKLINGLANQSTAQGAFARVRPSVAIRTAEGYIEQGQTVLLDLSAFGKLGVIHPQAAKPTSTSAVSQEVASGFNNELQEHGEVNQTVVQRDTDDLNDDDEPVAEDNNDDTQGSNPHFLSSPTCDCKGGTCSISSYFGHRKSFKTANGNMSTGTCSRVTRVRRNGRIVRVCVDTPHEGIDIATSGHRDGTPIVASADGCVSQQLYSRYSGFGRTVFIKHEDGFETQYSHLRSFVSNIDEMLCENGGHVKRGQVIAYMGHSGNATGPHLHFGVLKDGRTVNPRAYLAPNSASQLSQSCEDLEAKGASSQANVSSNAQKQTYKPRTVVH